MKSLKFLIAIIFAFTIIPVVQSANNEPNVKEYTIACLLDKESVDQLKQAFPKIIDEKNYPHITLFQFRCGDKNFVSQLRQYMKGMTLHSSYPTSNIAVQRKNLLLHIHDDSSLQVVSSRLAAFYNKHCTQKLPLTQLKLDELNSKQLEAVGKYGSYWFKIDYMPHVTLSYAHSTKCASCFTAPKTVTVKSPDIYVMDKEGRVINPPLH